MKVTHIATVAAFVALNVAGAQAEPMPGNAFQALDADVNGFITQDEAAYTPDLTARWRELDRDKNNLLDTSEFSAFELDGESPAPNLATPAGMPTE